MKKKKKSGISLEDRLRDDIFFFIEFCWGYKPQPIKKKFKKITPEDWTVEMFGDKRIVPYKDEYVITYDWYKFEHGKHLSWQQSKVFAIIQKELKRCKNKKHLFKKVFAITSARGIGKTFIMAMATIFFFSTRVKIGGMALAPTGESSKGTVWGQIDSLLKEMPEEVRRMMIPEEDIIITKDELKRQDSKGKSELAVKNTLTRRTSNKENPGSIAGYHNEFVVYALDEMSGIPDAPVDTLLEGFNSYEERLVMGISNPRITAGCTVFQDIFTKPEDYDAVSFSFSGEESPFKNADENISILKKNYNNGGRESYQYLVNALGEYSEELMDIPDGWVQAVELRDLDIRESHPSQDDIDVLAQDPTGGGNDNGAMIGRNDTCIRILENKKYPKVEKYRDNDNIEQTRKVAHIYQAKDLHKHYSAFDPEVAFVDTFGVGADTVNYYYNEGKYAGNIKGYNIGNPVDAIGFNKHEYNTFRSQQIDSFIEWINPSESGKSKAVLVGQRKDWIELTKILYRMDKGRKIYISKEEYKKMGIKSLNVADACVHSMMKPVLNSKGETKEEEKIPKRWRDKKIENDINYADIC